MRVHLVHGEVLLVLLVVATLLWLLSSQHSAGQGVEHMKEYEEGDVPDG
jgi:hypothetical protein